jgi:acyl-CoA synthetase (AMP-forming)/AMP-acid ligase II
MVNLSSFVRFHATRTPDRLAVVYRDQRITYRDLLDRVEQLAAWLAERGVGPETVVACFMKNSAAFLELSIAVGELGGVFLPINYRLAAEEVRYIVQNSSAQLLVADLEFEERLGRLPSVAYVDEPSQSDTRRLVGARRERVASVPRREGDLFRLMYTSGTTDRPKGVMHTYGNFYWKSIDHVIFLGLTASDRLLVVGPMYHVGAYDLPGLAVLWVGGMMCIHRDFDADATLRSIQDERLTCGWMAPVMTSRVLDNPHRHQYDVSSFRWCIGGGEKTPEARARAFTGLFTNGRYIDGYGLTETCSGDTLMEAGMEIAKIGSTGRALAHVRIEIRNEDGQPLAPGEQGEVCVCGPKVTTGYWKDPVRTAASFWPAGWFRTGDVGYLDADGFLYLTDRKKDLVISGGENIASSEVERVLYDLPQIAEVAVVGKPDEQWGERLVAVVVLRPGATLDLETVTAHCRKHLAAFKVPRELEIREALPRNPSGKILKRVLRDEFAAPGGSHTGAKR